MSANGADNYLTCEGCGVTFHRERVWHDYHNGKPYGYGCLPDENEGA